MSAKNIIRFLIIPAAVLIAFIAVCYSVDSETNSTNIKYINSCRWQVEERCADISYITIPEEFDKIFTGYNEIQKRQGLDLSKYKKKKVMRYTYEITNYEGEEGKVYANVIVYRNRVIGGDICSARADGFIHGFEKP